MNQQECLNSVDMEDKTAALSNVITSYMIENQMTLQVLDRACENVNRIYRENATIKKADTKSANY